MKRYPALDILRFFCACLVVMIHVGTSDSTPIASMLVTCFARQAVPYFFIVSGFFFFSKFNQADNKKDYVFRYTKRMLLFYILWAIISLPQLLSSYIHLYASQPWMYIAAILARRIFFAGSGQFWYLLALAETALIAGYLLIRRKEKILYALAALGICLNILYMVNPSGTVFTLYHQAVYSLFSWNNNFIMTGIPFFSLGVFLAQNQQKIRIPSHYVGTLYCLVSIVGLICYCVLVNHSIDPERFLFLFIIQAVLLFLAGINMHRVQITPYWSELFRSCSSSIYCLHSLVIEYVLGDIIPWSNYFALNLFSVIAVCLLLYFLIRSLKFKSLYSLISLK